MATSWLITGGSSGLGLSLGRTVLEKGQKAILTTRSIPKAQAAAPDIEKLGGSWLELDFSDEHLEKIVNEALQRWNIDTVVNNAGYPLVGPIENLSAADIRAQYEVNLFAPLRIIQAAIPHMRKLKSGTIINIGSSVSYNGMATNAIYGSTKSALRTVTEGLAGELAAFGIRAILIEPGRFRTNFGAGITIPRPGAGYDEVYKGTAVEQILNFLEHMGPAPGDPEAAAARIFEIATKTGSIAESVVSGGRFPLGSDAHQSLIRVSEQWTTVAKDTQSISTSTDFKAV